MAARLAPAQYVGKKTKVEQASEKAEEIWPNAGSAFQFVLSSEIAVQQFLQTSHVLGERPV